MDDQDHAPPRCHAVLCSLAELPDGRLRVVLDDLRRADTAGLWQHRTFVTYQDYPADMLAIPGGLSDAALAEFGFNVLVRLLAINGHLPDTDDPPDSDAHLTGTQRRIIESLTGEDIASIDQQLLSHCDDQFRKIVFIVGSAMQHLAAQRPQIADVFYASRIRALVERGLLEAAGDLSRMRYGEVRRTR